VTVSPQEKHQADVAVVMISSFALADRTFSDINSARAPLADSDQTTLSAFERDYVSDQPPNLLIVEN
jgi:hypothetical protein